MQRKKKPNWLKILITDDFSIDLGFIKILKTCHIVSIKNLPIASNISQIYREKTNHNIKVKILPVGK